MKGSAGYMVAIKLDNGKTVRYLHLNSILPLVVGNRVDINTQVGNVAGSGYYNLNHYSYHLHFDVNTVGAWSGGTGSSYVNQSTTLNPVTFFANGSFS